MENLPRSFYILFMVIVAFALLFMVRFPGTGSGETITVDDDGDADYEWIQSAIDASEDGDTVRVYAGSYEWVNLVVNKSINLIGNGSETTTISGFLNAVVKITADWVNMSGFNVTGTIYGYAPDYAGAILVESDNNTISNNICSNANYGIVLYSSRDCTIENNIVENNLNGIYLSRSSYCTIENNTCNDGIKLFESINCNIEYNTMSEKGICIFGSNVGNHLEIWNSHTVGTTNTVNGKPVYYYKNTTGFTVPSGAGQVILANCTWINVENQNISNGLGGIDVAYSSNITITTNSAVGIYLLYSPFCTITDNICNSNNSNGIELDRSSYCTVENNIIVNSFYGIDLDRSSYCTISNNICSSNSYYGIFLLNSPDCTITDNTCSSNGRRGIYLYSSSACTIENNNCSNNDDGIHLLSSSTCTIVNNTITENNVGIYLRSSSRNNTAHHNNIYNNTDYGINATDNDGFTINATNNYWGAASGPYHPAKNSGGGGNNITEYVEFDPWLEEKVQIQKEEDGNIADDHNDDGFLLVFTLISILSVVVVIVDVRRRRQPDQD